LEKIAIIGGGISGIAAGLMLAKSGRFELSLFEAADRLGGVLETVNDQGFLIERSADNFSTLIPDARELSVQFGMGASLIHPNAQGRRAFVLINRRVLPIPTGFSLMQPTRLTSILTTRTLSLLGKMRLFSEYFVSARDGNDDESLESFASRRLGREAYEKLVEPIVSGIFTANPATLSMQATMPQFLEMEQKSGGLIRGYLASRRQHAAAVSRRASGARYDQFVAPKEGMSGWIEGLSRHLPKDAVKLSTQVVGLTQILEKHDRPLWSLHLKSDRMPIWQETFDAVILATPASVTAKLLESVDGEAARLVGGIPYASSAVVALVLRRADLGQSIDGFGLVVPRREKRSTLAISFSSNKYPGRVPDDLVLMRIFLGGALRPEVVDMPDADILQMAHTELRDILRISKIQPEWQQVIRWKNSMPQYLVGHVARMAQLDQTLSGYPSLQLCGAAYSGVGIPQCVRSGKKAAQRLIDLFAAADQAAQK
jgi:oxygen-dependent protoporphyrinogen oxidase